VRTAAATPGCGKAPTLTSGTHTIQSSGKNRSFILRIPDGYDRNRAYRLVFGFHWLGGTATDVATGRSVEAGTWSYYGLQRLANNSAIFVAPQGLNNGWANAGGEDVTFVDDMIRRIDGDALPGHQSDGRLDQLWAALRRGYVSHDRILCDSACRTGRSTKRRCPASPPRSNLSRLVREVRIAARPRLLMPFSKTRRLRGSTPRSHRRSTAYGRCGR
jgi:hypothetical protein